MKTFISILFIAISLTTSAQSVFVLAKEQRAKELLVYELQKNRVQLTDDMSSATYVVEVVMDEVKKNIFNGYIRLVKNSNNKELYKTESIKNKPRMGNGYNPQKAIVKDIMEKKDFYAITDYLKEKAPLKVE